MASYRIIYTQYFVDDVSAAMEYVLTYANEYHSNKLRLQVDNTIKIIGQFPEAGRNYYTRNEVVIRRLAVLGSKFSVFYSIIGNDIFLLNLAHGSAIIK